MCLILSLSPYGPVGTLVCFHIASMSQVLGFTTSWNILSPLSFTMQNAVHFLDPPLFGGKRGGKVGIPAIIFFSFHEYSPDLNKEWNQKSSPWRRYKNPRRVL